MLLKTGNVLKPLAKGALIPLGLTAAELATDAAIHKKMFRYDCPLDFASRTTTSIISNEDMNDVMKIIKSLKESGLLIKGVSKTISKRMKQKNKKDDFSECY